jgi:exoribonuclease R
VTRRPIRLVARAEDLRRVFAEIRAEIGIPEAFPPDVLAEASEAPPPIPDADLTDVPFITIDPPGSMDLDQALHLERLGTGFRLRYAIADVAAFVTPGGAVDAESQRRIQTMYSPDVRVRLYPPTLSEGAASLLPDGPRPAIVWRIDVDDAGATVAVDVGRALVRSRAQLTYADVQSSIDDARAGEMLSLLPEIGRVLLGAERARGGASLNVPEQEVVEDDGGYRLTYRMPLPVEAWNAQLSLLTGRSAADVMQSAGVGILRTMPSPDRVDVRRLRLVAEALGIDWPQELPYAELLHTLEYRHSTAEAVLLREAAVLFRGASYLAFDGAAPEGASHAAIAAPYAHCTAPLRRLVDRYANEVCLAISAGADPPGWAREALPVLPEQMSIGTDRANRLERTTIDAVEAAVLAPAVGRAWDALVVDLWKRHRGEVALREPAVIGPCDGIDELGERITARLEEADLARRSVRFIRVPASGD